VSKNKIKSSNLVDPEGEWTEEQFLSSAETYSSRRELIKAKQRVIRKAARKERVTRRPRAPHHTTQYTLNGQDWEKAEEMEKCTLNSMIGTVVIEEIETAEREFMQRDLRAEIGSYSLICRELYDESSHYLNPHPTQQGDKLEELKK
jgi:hypothetical protein